MSWREVLFVLADSFVSMYRYAIWWAVIFTAVYAAEMAAFYRQGKVLLDGMR